MWPSLISIFLCYYDLLLFSYSSVWITGIFLSLIGNTIFQAARCCCSFQIFGLAAAVKFIAEMFVGRPLSRQRMAAISFRTGVWMAFRCFHLVFIWWFLKWEMPTNWPPENRTGVKKNIQWDWEFLTSYFFLLQSRTFQA